MGAIAVAVNSEENRQLGSENHHAFADFSSTSEDFAAIEQKIIACMDNPRECDCSFGKAHFDEICRKKTAAAIRCLGGEEEVCEALSRESAAEFGKEREEEKSLLVSGSGEGFNRHFPKEMASRLRQHQQQFLKQKEVEGIAQHAPECAAAGITTREECMKYLFTLHASSFDKENGFSPESEKQQQSGPEPQCPFEEYERQKQACLEQGGQPRFVREEFCAKVVCEQ